MKKITQDWLHSAESDLLLIQRIMDQEQLSHQLAFHAQQAVEKSFKAVIEEFDLGFIKTHSLETLSALIKDKIDFSMFADMFIILDQLYIDARYPGEMGLLPNGKPTVAEAKEFAAFTENVFQQVYRLFQ